MTKNKKKILRIVIVCAAALAAAAIGFNIVCLILMSQDNIAPMYTLTEEDDSFMGTLLKGAVTGREFDLSEAQINTYLKRNFCGDNKPLRKIRVYFHNEKPSEVYARVYCFGAERALYADAEIELMPERGQTAVRVNNVKIGELHIHGFVLDNVLQDFADSNPLAEYTDGVLYIKTEYSYEGKNFSLTLKLEKLEPGDRIIVGKTNSLTMEAVNAVKDYLLSDDGQEFFKGLFGEKINDIKNFVLRLLF